MYKILKNILPFICVVAVLSSCKCDKKTYSFGSQLSSFSNFKAGSYWIMRDSVTSNIDSLVVLAVANATTGGNSSSSNPKCIDEVETKSFVIAAFHLSPTRPDNLSMTFTIDAQGRNIYTFQRGTGDALTDVVNLDFIQPNVYVNGTPYDSVAVNDYTDNINRHVQLYFHPANVLLKVGYEVGSDRVVWQLIRANIIR